MPHCMTKKLSHTKKASGPISRQLYRATRIPKRSFLQGFWPFSELENVSFYSVFIGRRGSQNALFSGLLVIFRAWKCVSFSVSPPSILNPLLFWIIAPKSNPFLERYYHRYSVRNWIFVPWKVRFLKIVALYNCLDIGPDASLYD